MRLLHHIELENFKRFQDKQRIELDHPAVLIGPNNCGKTSAIQALALWSQAVKTWHDTRKESAAKERTATALNRLSIVSVPVQRTRFFWHNTNVRTGNHDIPLIITVGVEYQGTVVDLPMRFRNQGDELVYCTPDNAVIGNMDLIEYAASLNVELLYPMSGLDTEEPVLQPGRIGVLLGQGRTAEVLRNLCLLVAKSSSDDWERIVQLMYRLFQATLETPQETSRGTILLNYHQPGVKGVLDVSSSGRGFQQMLLIFAYLYSHKRSVLLIDEPDAHLEILRQKQVYVLLRDIAAENRSQVVIVTHSEVILDEALENNLTLLLEGRADDLAHKAEIRQNLKQFGAAHYIKARERGYVLYVEGGTDVDMLHALARLVNHPVATVWDERINSFYVQNNYPDVTTESELERVEGGFGVTPRAHFNALRSLLPDLRGLAILDNDGRERKNTDEGALRIIYWNRYEAENYFITPELLRQYARKQYADMELFGGFRSEIDQVLDEWTLSFVFAGNKDDFAIWKGAAAPAARVIWESKTQYLKLSTYAEDFFRRLAERVHGQMLLKKGGLHNLIGLVAPQTVPAEVKEKLDCLHELFRKALPPEGVTIEGSAVS
jgi:predicted ATPase